MPDGALCVGGPYDGKIVARPDWNTWRVREQEPFTVTDYNPDAEYPQFCTYTEHLYTRVRTTGNPDEVWLYEDRYEQLLRELRQAEGYEAEAALVAREVLALQQMAADLMADADAHRARTARLLVPGPLV